jgi:glycogen debranching enzyme
LQTAPHLRSAFELDEAIVSFSASLEGSDEAVLQNSSQLDALVGKFKTLWFQNLKLYEFYVLPTEKLVAEFTFKWNSRQPLSEVPKKYENIGKLDFKDRVSMIEEIAVTGTKSYLRFSKQVNIEKFVEFVNSVTLIFSITDATKQIDEFVQIINVINSKYYQEYDWDCDCIFEQIKNRATFLRLEGHGPKLGGISSHSPLVDTYFARLPENELTKKLNPDQKMLACNGWIWNADPLVNFAGPSSKAYLRREVIPWGDCVKLRYGEGPTDNPWLWNHQTAYTVKMANMFHGFRIDNCHSTPMHVAAYFLDKARKVRPNLYVFAELFTGSEKKDIIFVARLGINSLIREAMNGWDPVEMSRLVHRQGGTPVGSFTIPPHDFPLGMLGHDTGSLYTANEEESGELHISIKSSTPHALFMDCTHDNETPHQKRTAADSLSTAALVAMSSCAIGSVKGYDEIVPKLLDIVGETRKYRLPKPTDGIMPGKILS